MCVLFQTTTSSGESQTAEVKPIWSRSGHDLLYKAEDQEIAVSYSARSGFV
jgi:hypothetical protein